MSHRDIYNERGELVTDPAEEARLLREILSSWRFQYKGKTYTDQDIFAMIDFYLEAHEGTAS